MNPQNFNTESDFEKLRPYGFSKSFQTVLTLKVTCVLVWSVQLFLFNLFFRFYSIKKHTNTQALSKFNDFERLSQPHISLQEWNDILIQLKRKNKRLRILNKLLENENSKKNYTISFTYH